MVQVAFPTNRTVVLDGSFWERVADTGTCWLWLGQRTSRGYGRFRFEGALRMAHRLAYAAEVGPIPDGYELDHLCRVHACVRPDHLQAVPHRVNVLRGEGLAAENAIRSHCRRGHALTPDNIYRKPSRPTERVCRACARYHRDQYRRRKRGSAA